MLPLDAARLSPYDHDVYDEDDDDGNGHDDNHDDDGVVLLLSSRREVSTPATPIVFASNREYRAYISICVTTRLGALARSCPFYRGRNYFAGECVPSAKIARNPIGDTTTTSTNARTRSASR